jgi:5-methylcytosine-specific restriction endonuclease McrA
MTAVKRPCLERGCPRCAEPGRSRCAEHQSAKERARSRTPSSTVTWTAKWKRIRAQLIRMRRREDGTWLCEICDRPITTETEIEVDHVQPVAYGGATFDESNLRLAHRRCNRRAGGLAQAEARKRKLAESRIGRSRTG